MTSPLDPRHRARIRSEVVRGFLSLPVSIGRYRIRGELGRGGMGIVYDAWDPELARPVAIKVIHAGRLGSLGDELLNRFQCEMRATAGLFHPNLVAILDAGAIEIDGKTHPYFVMERVDGESLEERVRRCGAPPPEEAVEIAQAVARGLDAVHTAGWVHRDVKPSNVLIPWQGEARLTDFGLCLNTHDPETPTGAVLGSAHYLAPEQIGDGPVDARADLFGLGAVILFLHTETPPFEASSFGAHLDRVARAEPDGLDELPEAIRDLTRRLLEKDPADRPESAAAVVEALGVIDTTRRPRRLRQLLAVALGLLGLAAIGLAGSAAREQTRLDAAVERSERQLQIQLRRARDLLPEFERLRNSVDAGDREAQLALHDSVSGSINRIAIERRRYEIAIAERQHFAGSLPWSLALRLFRKEESVPRLDSSRIQYDGTAFTADESKTLEEQLELLEREFGVDARLLLQAVPSGISIEHLANQHFERALGRAPRGERGLLFLVDDLTHTRRVEVGYALEAKLTDAFLGAVLRDVAVARAKSDDRELAWRIAICVIRDRLRRANGGWPSIGPESARQHEQPFASGGGGATRRGARELAPPIGQDPHSRQPVFDAAPTPESAYARYQVWLDDPRADAGLLTPDSRKIVAAWPMTETYRRHLVKQHAGPRRILAHGRFGVAVPTADPLALPQFLVQGEHGWQVDLAAHRRHVLAIAGGGATWTLRDVDRPPLDRFRNQLTVVDGLVRFRIGDNRVRETGRRGA